jgi:hypothetical protein
VTELTYHRLSATRPPVREQLVLGADGTVELWRSNGPVVGRLAGGGDGASLTRLLTLAQATPPPDQPATTADPVYEVLEAGEATISLAPGAAPDGPWGGLLAACRSAVDHPGVPIAAVGLVIEAPGRLRLEHRGSDTLRVGLGAVIAETIAYRDGTQAGLAQSRFADGAVDAGPGWSQVIELEPLDTAGASVVASVSFSANDGGVWVPVRCEVTATG